MNKCKNRVFVTLLVFLALCFTACPTEASAEETGTWTTYDGEQFYTSDDLNVLAKYMSEQSAEYADTVRLCYEGSDATAFNNVTVSGEKYMPFWSMVYAIDDDDSLNDGITLRYTRKSSSWSYWQDEGKYYYVFNIQYRQTKEQMNLANAEIKKAVNNDLKIGKSSGKTDYQKVKAIHDYICGIVTYDNSFSYYSEYFGLFAPHTFVCQGYALLFDKMCEEAGVASYIMSGEGEGSGGWGRHAWNFVKIAEKWYFMDVTWNDAYWDAGKQYSQKYPYFLLDENTFMKEHRPDALFYGKDQYPAFCVCPGYEVLDIASEKYQLTVSFDSRGGNKIESKKVEIEGKMGALPGDPVRQGYTFAGWYPNPDGSGDALTTATRIYDNVTYYAKWEADSAVKYTVIFDAQDGGVVSLQEIAENGVVEGLPTPRRNGYTFLGWYTAASGGERITGSEPITADVTYYAHWSKNIVNYTVTFDAQGGSAVPSQTVEENETIGTLPATNKSGYTFLGWYTSASGEDRVTGAEPITGDVTYYAHWSKDIVNYTVTFDAQGGSSVPSQTVEENETIGTLPTTNKNGYTFLGWYTEESGGEEVTGSEPITADVTYYAHWSKDIVNYTVTFDAQGGSAVPSQTVEENEIMGTLPTPDKSGYTFLGWYTAASGGEKITGNEPITGDVTYYAHWSKNIVNYMVTFDAQGGSSVPSQTVAENESVGTLPTTNRNGYTFLGWYTSASGGEAVTGAEPITADVTYYAHWSKDIVNYMVTFDAQGGSSVPSQTVAENESIGTLPTTNRSGYTFLGWFTAASGGEEVLGGEPITGDVTYYAHWSKDIVNYTVTFDAQGGSTVPSQTVEENGKVGTLPTTNKSGYTFLGWYTAANGGEAITGSEPITGDVTYYAHWSKNIINYTVTFDAQGGSSVPSQTVAENETIGTLPTPARSGYTFLGWYTSASGGNRVTGNERITGNVTYYAHWSELPQYNQNMYTVTFDAQGGNPVAAQTVTENTALSYIPTAYRAGYIFMGWYTNSNGYGSQLTSTTIITNDTVYYAYWLTASITNDIGSVINNPSNPNEVVVLLGNSYDGEYIQVSAQVGLYESLRGYCPCKAGYDFKGWYLDENLTQPVTPDSRLSSGMKIYAKWEKINNWKLNKKKVTLKAGKTVSLKVAGLSSRKVRWKSLNPRIATVSANGKVKAKKAGKVKIIAITEDGSVMGCTVVVKKNK